MKLLVMIVGVMCALASPAGADSRGDAAAAWIDAIAFGKTVPKLTAGKPIQMVFDSGTQFATTSACGKLKTATLATDADLVAFAGCVRAALLQLALDKQQPPKSAELVRTAGAKYLRGWLAKPFHSKLVTPSGQQLIGTSINRPLAGKEGLGVALMIYVLVDASDRVTAVYAYAGHWSYPV